MPIQQETQWITRRLLTSAELQQACEWIGTVNAAECVDLNGSKRCGAGCVRLSIIEVTGRNADGRFLCVLWWHARPLPWLGQLRKVQFGSLLTPDVAPTEHCLCM